MAFVPEDYWQIRGFGARKTIRTLRSRSATPPRALPIRRRRRRLSLMWSTPRRAPSPRSRSVVASSSRATPFNTTSLQAAAAAEGISPARTHAHRRKPLHGGVSSRTPRVDNTVYPRSLDLKGVVDGLAANNPALRPVCQKVLARPHEAHARQDRDHRPPAHSPHRPGATRIRSTAGQKKLYMLIARRFLATLMGPATIENTKLAIDVAGEPFTASGDVLVDAGFRRGISLRPQARRAASAA